MTKWTLAAVLAASTLLACRVDDGPQDSSGSHWLSCNDDADCIPYDPNSVCGEGYCEDALGVRLEADLFPVNGGSAGANNGPTPTSGMPMSGTPTPGIGAAGNASEGPSDSGTCEQLPNGLPVENVYEGDYTITGPSSVEAAALFSEISGTLIVGPRAEGDLAIVELPGLERVGGGINANGSTLTQLVLPSLETIAGDLVLNNNAGLEATDFRSLNSVGGSVSVLGSDGLTTLNMGALTSVAGDVSFGPSVMANCEVQLVLDNLGTGLSYTDGRDDCSCTIICSRIAASCP